MSNPSPPLRLGFIGCGGITQEGHLPALRTVAEIEVVALADLDPNRLQSAGDRFGISHRYRDAAALLADPAVVAGVNHLWIIWREGQTMLVRMDAVAALRRNVGPACRAAAHRSPIRIDGAYVDLVLIVGCRGHVPVVPGLIDIHSRRRGNFCPDCAHAAPQMRPRTFSGKSIRYGRSAPHMIDGKPCQITGGPGRKGDGSKAVPSVDRHEKSIGKRGEDLHRPSSRMDADVPAFSRPFQTPRGTAVGRFVESVGRRGIERGRCLRIDD